MAAARVCQRYEVPITGMSLLLQQLQCRMLKRSRRGWWTERNQFQNYIGVYMLLRSPRNDDTFNMSGGCRTASHRTYRRLLTEQHPKHPHPHYQQQQRHQHCLVRQRRRLRTVVVPLFVSPTTMTWTTITTSTTRRRNSFLLNQENPTEQHQRQTHRLLSQKPPNHTEPIDPTDTPIQPHHNNNIHNTKHHDASVVNLVEEQHPNTISTKIDIFATTTTTTTEVVVTTKDPYWMERFIPKSYRPYAYLARLDKPIGTMLLFWPCVWSIGLATTPYLTTATTALMNTDLPPVLPLLSAVDPSVISTTRICMHQLYIVSLFGIGAIVMRGAGCTVNDLWDRRYDQHVTRTKDRPLVNGSVTPSQAIQFVLLQSSIGLCVLLSLQPHVIDCIYWGCLSLPLVVIYPTMKRFFSYPQLVLGMTFNWGAILGWVAVHGSSNIDWTIVGPLYGSGITWTLVYDTLYAHQDKKDDAKLQLRSTALSFGPNDDRQRTILHGLAALTWLQWLLVGYTAFDNTYGAFIPYYAGGVTLAYSHLIWQIQTADFDNPSNLAQRFRSNNTTGAIVAGAISTALAAQILL